MKVIIVGGGKVGIHLASLLLADDHHVSVIEPRDKHVTLLYQRLPPETVIVKGSGTDPKVLEKAGIRSVDIVAAVTGADETNLVVTNLARFEFAVPRTIARVNDPRNVWMFVSEMGVDVALNQSDLMAHLITEEMSLGELATLLKLHDGQFAIVEERLSAESRVVGKMIRDLNFPSGCVIVAIMRSGSLVIPRGDTRLEAGDEFVALVQSALVSQIAAIFQK